MVGEDWIFELQEYGFEPSRPSAFLLEVYSGQAVQGAWLFSALKLTDLYLKPSVTT